VAVVAASRTPKRYPEEFRRDAARLVIDSGRSLRDVGLELSVNSETLRSWVLDERAREEAKRVNAEGPLEEDERRELEQLRRRNAELEQDVAFLKKAAAFFAREQGR
jgi:transposase